jgi:lysozyme family protein
MTDNTIRKAKGLSLDKFVLLSKYDVANKAKEFQHALNSCGQNILVDGIIGKQTIDALRNTNIDDLTNALKNTSPEELTEKEEILAYLAREEGTVFHWNKGEESYTTPYGVYKHANKKSDVIRFTDSLIRKYHILETRRGIKKLNNYITNSERRRLKDLVYDLYISKYTNKRVDEVLRTKGLGKLRLSMFSTSVNAGLKTAIVKLQQTLGIYPDGLVGDKTILAINLDSRQDSILNEIYLTKVKKYYDSLMLRSEYYTRYRNGWYNRLRRLGLTIV